MMCLVLYVDYFDEDHWASREVAVREVETFQEYSAALQGVTALGFRRSVKGRLPGDMPALAVKDESP